MNKMQRLPMPFGSRIDRATEVQFEFDGRSVTGYAGDTIASALVANGEWLLSRSFKYHRPRGILTMAGQDANTLVQLPGEPNCVADRRTITPGMRVAGQNYSGSLRGDRNRLIGAFARFLPVGFYYHAFFRPRGVWNLWSRFFRRRAGLGVIDESQLAHGFDKRYRFCDVVVVGGGPGGMRAALDAAAGDAEMLLVDDQPTLGGSLNYARQGVDAEAERELCNELVTAIDEASNIEVMVDAVVTGWYADNWLSIVGGKRLHKLRAREVVLATGSLEQHALFRNNDLPGVIMGTAAQRLIKLYGVRPGRRAVVLAGNDDAYGVALDLADADVDVAVVADCREHPSADERAAAVANRGIEVVTGHTVYAARAQDQKVMSVELRRIGGRGRCEGDARIVTCDFVCMSVGFMPAWQLACQAGATLDYDDDTAAFTVSGLPDGVRFVPPRTSRNFDWPMFRHPKGKEFVDFDEDLQIADIVNAVRAGYSDIQLVKRYSTCGMGPSQGRHSALPAARLVADATGRTVSETGVTTARPPFAAETLAHCAGQRFYPALRTSMHHRHLEAGATMLQAGAWYRPAYYGDDGTEAINEEVLRIRRSVGLIDVSTLGGIDVHGPDAAEFLNRIYTFAYAKQSVGTLRYALMTNEAGVVIDDGVVCRRHEQRFYVTATTGGVDAVYRSMLKWNAQWGLDVTIVNVTSAYAAVNIAGPASRDVLARLCDDVNLDGDGFPYLAVREGHVAGIPALMLRVGFVGELGFEIHVPQHAGEALWDAVLAAGETVGIGPVGIEAQRMLRLEKGHIIVGQDTDAMSHPEELQMDWAIARKKPYFVGLRTLDVIERRPLARKLVGLRADDGSPLPREGHLVVEGDSMIGRVTSCGYSPTLKKIIGLAFVPPQRAEPGSRISIGVDSELVAAEVVALPFYDPDGARQAL